MTAETILTLMQKFFAGKLTPEQEADFGGITASSLLKESLDVVDFIVYLEEELSADIPIGDISDSLMNQSFRGLSEAIAGNLSAPAAAAP